MLAQTHQDASDWSMRSNTLKHAKLCMLIYMRVCVARAHDVRVCVRVYVRVTGALGQPRHEAKKTDL